MKTTHPKDVAREMMILLQAYHLEKEHDLLSLARFHAHYEKIHPFQDGNGRTGRMILFRECLYNGIIPVIIKDHTKLEYYRTLRIAQSSNDYAPLTEYFYNEQKWYYEILQEFLYEME